MPSLLGPDGDVIATDLRWAVTARARVKGLLGSHPPDPGSALALKGAKQVHTIGMRFAIDVVFVDDDFVVLYVVRGMRPFRVSRWVRGAAWAIEMGPGGAEAIRVGDRLGLDQEGGSSNPVE